MKKGRCKDGNYAKQRITVLLIVNALGEKEPLIIIGRSLTTRCFKNGKDKRRLCGSYGYAKKKSLDGFRAYGGNFKNFTWKMRSRGPQNIAFH